MRLNDAVLGCIFLLVAVAVALTARGFPAVPGQDYGASSFPMLIAAGFAGCGLVLIRSGLRERTPLVEWRPWTRNSGLVVNVLAIIFAVVFYILVSAWLGFIPTTALILVALLRRFRVGWGTTLALAILAPLIMQYMFGNLLLVPLPWGLLAPIRWG
ncbi:MAG: tripartite tricarboxylate transporter TctB family protein [Rhodobacteraceae bacterium]|nr:tripartite tricarboxylate transporter TctB family protein [Paracoccaceae bacterium]